MLSTRPRSRAAGPPANKIHADSLRRSHRRGIAGFGALLGLLGLLAALGSAVHAQSGGERITAYGVEIAIEDSGAILVTESIAYDFGSEQRHGILRDIPVRLQYDADAKFDRVYPLDVLEVRGSSGTPDEYTLETLSSGELRIRVGDPDRTISGAHTYTIRYRVRGALNGFDDHDELYWNAIGAAWGVPIDRASVQVTAPAAPTRVACYAGPLGSRLSCESARIEDGAAHFTTSRMSPYQAFTVVVALPKGVVPEPAPILEERWSLRRAFTVSPATVLPTLALLAGVTFFLGRLFWTTGRDRRWAGSPVQAVFGPPGSPETTVPMFEGGPYPAEYIPPEGMRPGLVGTLIDEKAHPLDITATIIDLAVRGYLQIEEIPKEGWFGHTDWRLKRLKPGDDLLKYERELLDSLFEDGEEVLMSDLRNKFAARLGEVQKALYEEVVARGWFQRSPDSTRNSWLVAGIVAAVAGMGLEALAIAKTHFALVPIPLAIGGLVLVAMHGWMPRRASAGTAAVRRVRGFRRFIEDAEDERARFAEQAHLFYDYLPYAIVFGLTERWARAFEGLAQAPETGGWYVSPNAFSVLAFSNSMNSFAVTSAGTIASTPGGSGGSGFGGGSGGGGGGGGGGSW